MSLINNLLSSLDQQADYHQASNVFQGMQATEPRSRWRVWLLMAVLIIASFSGLYFLMSWQKQTPTQTSWQQTLDRQPPASTKPKRQPTPVQATPAQKQHTPQRTSKPLAQTVAPMKAETKSQTVSKPSSAQLHIVEKPVSDEVRRWVQIEGLVEQADWQRAEKRLALFVNDYPQHLQAATTYVELLASQQRWRSALQVVSTALSQQQHNDLLLWQGRILVEIKRFAEAIKLLEALSVKIGATEELSALVAGAYQQLNKHPEAIAWYQKALQQNPAASRWWLGVALSSEAIADIQTARQAYQRVLQDQRLDQSLRRFAAQRDAALP